MRRTQQVSADIAALEAIIAAGAPAPGTNIVGSAAAHPSDAPEPATGPNPTTKGEPQPRSKRAARSGTAQGGIAGSKGTSDGGNPAGTVVKGNPGADLGYTHAKLFTELPLSRHTQVCWPRNSVALIRSSQV